MQDSARSALSWVRSHAVRLGPDPTWFADHDVHLHIPAGAIPKDGPSAGITMATAIFSFVREVPDSDEAAMSGENTLAGQEPSICRVLPERAGAPAGRDE